MLLGSAEAAEEAEVLDQDPVRQAQHRERDSWRTSRRWPVGRRTDQASATTAKRLTANPAPDRVVKALTQAAGETWPGAIPCRAYQGARLPVEILPESASRPGLQHRHGDQEQAQPGEDACPSQTRHTPPGSDQPASHAVDEDGARGAEQPRVPGAKPRRRTPETQTTSPSPR
jgi:hypothetical protein